MPRGVVLAGAGDARHLQNAALEEELARRTIPPVGQNFERVQQPEPPLQPEPEPVEAHLGGARPRRYRPPPVRQRLPIPSSPNPHDLTDAEPKERVSGFRREVTASHDSRRDSSPSLAGIRDLNAEVAVGPPRGDPAAAGALYEAALQEVRL